MSVKAEPGLSGDYASAESKFEKADSQLDDDIYEDAGDLDFSQASQSIYLARLPKYLWKAWSMLGDKQEVQVGTIRVEGTLNDPKRMSLMLSAESTKDPPLPKEYSMQVMNNHSTNTYMFTEKDLPGYSARPGEANSRAQDPNSRQDKLTGNSRVDKGKRFRPYQRKTVPKKTSFIGQVNSELNCLPVENEDFRRVMDERTRQELKPRRETQILQGFGSGGSVLTPGTLGDPGGFGSFIKTSANRPKGQDLRAARMPQNELLDRIYDCFKRYSYWPLKSLKEELNQPDAYLKETLELVARLIRQGPHAMTWELKPEAMLDKYTGQPSDTSGQADGGGGDGDSSVKKEPK